MNRFEVQPPPGHQQVRSYRNWNPPMLGNLPDDFLRILPQQLSSTTVRHIFLKILSLLDFRNATLKINSHIFLLQKNKS